jgi:hypothetical protein
MPVCFGGPVVELLVCFLAFAREAMGAFRAPGIPCSLYSRDTLGQTSDASRRENVGLRAVILQK